MKRFLIISIFLPVLLLSGCKTFTATMSCGPDTCAIETSDDSLSIEVEKGGIGVGATIEY